MPSLDRAVLDKRVWTGRRSLVATGGGFTDAPPLVSAARRRTGVGGERPGASVIGAWAGLCVGVGALAGWASGSLAWGVAAALGAWTVVDAAQAGAFRRWARAPFVQPRLAGALWQAPALRLHGAVRRPRDLARQVIAELRWLQDTLDWMPDGWIVLRPGGTIEAVNHTARGLLGLAKNDRRRRLPDILREPAVKALVGGQVEDDIVELASPVDETRRLELRHRPVEGDRAIILIRDVTMLNRLLTMRQDFIANVSHELRTPLTVIIGYLEALDDEDIDKETLRRLLGRMHSPAGRMKALVEDLLTLTRLESSPMPGKDDIEEVYAAGLLESAVNEARQLATPAHDIVLEADPALRAQAVPSELHSAFSNLIANAIRYSPDGGVVNVRWRRGDAGPRFEVEDRGIGIPQEHISRLTERFFRVDIAKSRVRGGTGLGLAIVKHVLRRHRTQLQVSSELGSGSLFSFELPGQQAQP